jgi:hypothetical protein
MHIVEHDTIYSSSRVTKQMGMKWAGHAVGIGEMKNA